MDIQKNVKLAQYTTLKLGGDARFFVRAQHTADIADACAYAKEHALPVCFLGGGSNLFFADAGYDGLVIKIENKETEWEDCGDTVRVTAGAGVVWDDLVAEAVERDLYGFENLSLIPGTVGAAVVQNIGAYGTELEERVECVDVLDRVTGKIETLTNKECAFGYRDSFFKSEKGKDYVVLSASFVLEKNGVVEYHYVDVQEYFKKNGNANPTLRDVHNAIITIRTSKLPDMTTYGTAGSYFKNPIIRTEHAKRLRTAFPTMKQFQLSGTEVKISAAWLLENLGDWKGVLVDGVGGYEHHALVFVTTESASSDALLRFEEEVRAVIFDKTNITLEREVVYVGP